MARILPLPVLIHFKMSINHPQEESQEERDARWEKEAWERANANSGVSGSGPAATISQRGEDAIWSCDIEKFKEALSLGWALPAFRVGASRGESVRGDDLSLVFQCISSGWTEGWLLMRERWPELASNDQILLAALGAARAKIVDDILTTFPRNKINKSVFAGHPRSRALSSLPKIDLFKTADNHEEGSGAGYTRSLHHELFSAMTRDVGEPAEQEDILACAAVLKKHGDDPVLPYPGKFDEGDMSFAGHTLWTLAIRDHKWEVAAGLSPSTLEEIQKHPRWSESLDNWFEIAWVGHRVMLYIAPPSHLAQEAWLSAIAPLASELLDVSDQLIRYGGWPAFLAMTPQQREPVIQKMVHTDPDDMSSLAWIALGAEHDLALANELVALLDREFIDKKLLAKSWCHSYQGVRPCDIWSRLTGTVVVEDWPPPVVNS